MKTLFALILGVSSLVTSFEGHINNLYTQNQQEVTYEEETIENEEYPYAYMVDDAMWKDDPFEADYIARHGHLSYTMDQETILNCQECQKERTLPIDVTTASISDGDIVAVPSGEDYGYYITLLKVKYTNSPTSFVAEPIGIVLEGLRINYCPEMDRECFEISNDGIIDYVGFHNPELYSSDFCDYFDYYYNYLYQINNRRDGLSDTEVWVDIYDAPIINLTAQMVDIYSMGYNEWLTFADPKTCGYHVASYINW